jgi:hypothetical protein
VSCRAKGRHSKQCTIVVTGVSRLWGGVAKWLKSRAPEFSTPGTQDDNLIFKMILNNKVK